MAFPATPASQPAPELLGQMWVQHSRKEAEIAGLEQSHVQSEESGGEGERNQKPARVAEKLCWNPKVPPGAPNDNKQI